MEGTNNTDNINCFELFRQAQLGNQESANSLAGLTREKLFVYIHRCTLDYDLAQDISQETVLQMIKSLKRLKFDSTESFWSWLYRTAMGKVLHHFRDRRNTVNMSALKREHLIQYASQNHPDGLKELINKELVEAVVEAIAGLKLRHRNILILRCYERLSYSQIAAILGCSELAAQSLFYRARCLLKRRLSKRGFGKGMFLPALGLFGSLTAPADAAWATVPVSAASIKVGPSAAIIGAAGSKLGITVGAAVIGVLATVGIMNPIVKTKAVREPAAVVVSEPAVETAILADSETIPETAAVVDAKPLTSADESTQIITDSLVADEPGETEFKTGITGVVTDKGTSRPIEGAELAHCFSESRRSVTTDANGYFELLDMRPGEQQYVSVIARDYTSQRMVVNVIKNEIYKDLKIELSPGAKVAGIVWDQDGEPVEAAMVKTFHFTNHPVVTGDDGEYEIDGLDPAFGTYYLHVSHPNYPDVRASFLSPSAGETVIKDVTLRPGVTIYGQITDVEGNPVADAEVGNTTSHSMWNCIKTKTDEGGLYELKKIPAGELVLWAISNEYAPYVGRFSLDSLQAEKLINIELADPWAMHGQIVDKAGNPMPGANVAISQYEGLESLGSHRVVSDEEGKFIIPNAPPTGKVTLSVWGENVADWESELEMGREEYVITVDRTGRLYGKVVSDRTSEPVSVFNIMLGASRKGLKRAYGYSASWSDYGHYFKSINGFFDTGMESLPIGAAYKLTIYAEGYNPLTIDPVIVQEITDDPNRIEFRLKPVTAIVGRVIGHDGLPIARARIRCLTDENKFEHYDDRDTTITGSEGEFALEGVDSENGLIYITAENFGSYLDSSSNLSRDSGNFVEIILDPGAEVFGRVVDTNGLGVPEARVSAHIFSEQVHRMLTSPWPNLKRTTTDEEGYYELFDLPAGPLSFGVNYSDTNGNLNTAGKQITLDPGQLVELNFGDEAGFTLTGIVRMGEELLEKASVWMHFSDESTKGVRTDSTGRFRITGIPQNTHRLITTYHPPFNTNTSPQPKTGKFDQRQVTIDSDIQIDIDLGDS